MENSSIFPTNTTNSSNGQNSEIASIQQKPVTLGYGLVSKAKFEHTSKNCNIQSVTYNSKTGDYMIVDSRGITAWTKSFAVDKTTRLMEFPAYQFNVIKILLYCRQLNVYFALTKDYLLKIYNLNFHETFSIESDTNALIHMLFNSTTGELVTASRSEIHIWEFGEINKQHDSMKAKYGLILKFKWSVGNGSLINRMSLDDELQRLYCLSETDCLSYDLSGKEMFAIRNASSTHLSACAYANASHSVIVGSVDGQINVLTNSGGKIHTSYSHISLITEIIIHPSDNFLIITASLDGYIKIFSIEILEELYSFKVFNEGIEFMALKSKDLLFCSSTREIEVFNLNYFCQLWGQLRYPAEKMELLTGDGKCNRVMTLDGSGSVKLFSCKNGRKLCTVLPPPIVDPLSKVLACVHDRSYNLIYLMVTVSEIWVYTSKTDPACFLAAIDIWRDTVTGMKSKEIITQDNRNERTAPKTNCNCIEVIRDFFDTHFIDNEGNEQTQCNLLACGMDSGEIILYNPLMSGRKENTIALCKDPIKEMKHQRESNNLLVITWAFENLTVRLFSKNFDMLMSVGCPHDITCFELKNQILATGFQSGHIIMQQFSMKAYTAWDVKKLMPDHQGGVNSVNFHSMLDVLLSSGKDSCIKIWSIDKYLLCEVTLDSSLTSACFLNGSGDILMGFKNHIFVVKHHGKFDWLASRAIEEDNGRPESAIYESRYVKYELRRPISPESDNMENYLVPYQDIMFTMGSWVVNQTDTLSDTNLEDQIAADQILSDNESFASSDIYQSSIFSHDNGEKLWDVPYCGSSPEGSVAELQSDVDTVLEAEVAPEEEKTIEPKVETENKKSRLQEMLAEADRKSARSRKLDFTHGATKKLKNAKIDSKQLKTTRKSAQLSKKVQENNDKQGVAYEEVKSEQKIPKEKSQKRKIAKKEKVAADVRRKVVPKQLKTPENDAPVIEKEIKENDPKTADAGYVSRASGMNDQEVSTLSPEPDIYGVSLQKNRINLVKNSSLEPSEEVCGQGAKEDSDGKNDDELKNEMSPRKISESSQEPESRGDSAPLEGEEISKTYPVIVEVSNLKNDSETKSQSSARGSPNSIKRHLPDIKRQTHEVVKVKVVPRYAEAQARTGIKDEEKNDPGKQTLTLTSEKVTLREPSARTRDHSAHRLELADEQRVGSRNSNRPKNRNAHASEVKTSRSVRVPFGEINEKDNFMSASRLKVKKPIPGTDVEDEEKRSGNLLKFCISALKKKKKIIKGQMSFERSRSEMVSTKRDDDLAHKHRTNDVTDPRPRTAPLELDQLRYSKDQNEEINPRTRESTLSSSAATDSLDILPPPDHAELLPFLASGTSSPFQREDTLTFLNAYDDDTSITPSLGEDTTLSPFLREEEQSSASYVHDGSPILRVTRDSPISRESKDSSILRESKNSPILREDIQKSFIRSPSNISDEPEIDDFQFSVTIDHKNKNNDSNFETTFEKRYLQHALNRNQKTYDHFAQANNTKDQPRSRNVKFAEEQHWIPKSVDHQDIYKKKEISINLYKKAKASFDRKVWGYEQYERTHLKEKSLLDQRSSPAQRRIVGAKELINHEKQLKIEESSDSKNLIIHRSSSSRLSSKEPAAARNEKTLQERNEIHRNTSKSKLMFINLPSESDQAEETNIDWQCASEDSKSHLVKRLSDAAQTYERSFSGSRNTNEQISRVASPQEHMMHRRAVSARLKERQESAKLRRGVIQDQKLARAQSKSGCPSFTGGDNAEKFSSEKDEEIQSPIVMYEYNKPVPLFESVKKSHHDNRHKSLQARLSGQPFRYGRPVVCNEDEAVIVDFIKLSMNKKSDEIILLPRPKSTASIPTKCYDYVLVTEKEKQELKPSKMEKELLRDRFREFSLSVS